MSDHFPDATKTVDFISRDEAAKVLCMACGNSACDPFECSFYKEMENIQAADVVSVEDYKHLLKMARAMHTWIFLNTCDEQKAYYECHLTDEDNDLLGYGGQFILEEQQ